MATTSLLKTITPRAGFAVQELSEQYGNSQGFWRAEIRSGRLPVVRLGRRVLVLESDLENYLNARRSNNPGEATK
ncbi:MAG: helix-turn-helix domain-containing protein [Acidobacteriaceae bacterium]|nr:helix-turn-helix domain-containing protein [Acidobacteriaceae bacterium]